MRHHEGCAYPDLQTFTGRLGDLMLYCRNCGRAAPVPLEGRSSPSEATVPAASRYRCREHDTPVTWKGTGCRRCAAERARGRRAPRTAPTEGEFTQ